MFFEYLRELQKNESLSPQEEGKLWAAYKKRNDAEARKRLILAYQPLVLKIASRYTEQKQKQNQMDLIQEGTLGLMEALERFEPGRGVQFSTYARHRIRGRILNYIGRVSTLSTLSLDDEDTLGRLMLERQENSGASVESRLEARQIYEHLLKALDRLPPKERRILSALFLEGADPGTIARELGCSKAHVYRLKKNGVTRVRGYLAEFWGEIQNA